MLASAIDLKSKNNLAKILLDRSGNRKNGSESEQVKQVANNIDHYYLKWNKVQFTGNEKGLGIGAVIALFEIVTASVLEYVENSPATMTNFITSLSENFQVLVAGHERTKRTKGKKSEKQLLAEEHKLEQAMAWVVAGGGVFGLYKWGKEMLHSLEGKIHDVRELPVLQKVGLTACSFVSALAMGVGYVEKTFMATLAKTQNGGRKAKQMVLNALSDLRCCFEWLSMCVFLWVQQFKPAKILIDFALPLSALQDGASHLIGDWIHHNNGSCNGKHTGHNHQHQEETSLKRFIKRIFPGHGNGEDYIKIPKMFYNKFFLGRSEDEGMRSMITPVFRAFDCKPFKCHLNEENNLVVYVPHLSNENQLPKVVKGNVPIKDKLTEALNTEERKLKLRVV